MLKADWAYDFACDQPIEVIPAAFNAAGPWQWQLRDSHFYGDYVSCRQRSLSGYESTSILQRIGQIRWSVRQRLQGIA